MNRLILLIALVVVAVGTGWFFLSERESPATAPPTASKRPAVRAKRTELESKATEALPTFSAHPRVISGKTQTQSDKGTEFSAIALSPEEAQRRADEPRIRQAEIYLKALGERLSLSSDQIATIKEILAKDGSAEAGIGTLGTPAFLPVLPTLDGTRSQPAEADDKIANVLSPAQQEEYAKLRQEKQAARTDKIVSHTVSSLQQQLDLSPEQASQLKEAFVQQADQNGPGAPTSIAQIKSRQKANLEALRSVLTADQFRRYQAIGTQPAKANP